jgi:hypothetical protein
MGRRFCIRTSKRAPFQPRGVPFLILCVCAHCAATDTARTFTTVRDSCPFKTACDHILLTPPLLSTDIPYIQECTQGANAAWYVDCNNDPSYDPIQAAAAGATFTFAQPDPPPSPPSPPPDPPGPPPSPAPFMPTPAASPASVGFTFPSPQPSPPLPSPPGFLRRQLNQPQNNQLNHRPTGRHNYTVPSSVPITQAPPNKYFPTRYTHVAPF